MTVLLLAGSPAAHSRTAAVLMAAGERLDRRGVAVERLQVRKLSAEALLLADFAHPSVIDARARVAQASALVIATPAYKPAYSGILKAFLDLLPQSALKGKTVLPLATGGSPHHMLALDYALRPVLQSLGARAILAGIYATDSQVLLLPDGGHQIDAEITHRIDEAVDILVDDNLQGIEPGATRLSPVHFKQARCSVD